MYTIPINNLQTAELADVVDSMPYKSGWAPGLGECSLQDARATAGVSVGANGLRVDAGGGVSFWWLAFGAAATWYLFFKK